MTTVKILLLSTAAVVGIGGTSVALTKDKWWPKKENINPENHDSEDEEVPPKCKTGTQECPEDALAKKEI